MTKPDGIISGAAMRMQAHSVSTLPTTPAGRMEFIVRMLGGEPILDDDGNDTGEVTAPLISREHAVKLMAEWGL